jgi:hypothetical protein
MTAKFLIATGILVLLAGLGILAYQLSGAPSSPSQEKDRLIADIIHDWQTAHPSENRFVLMPPFNNAAVLDKETGLVWELAPDSTRVTWNEARRTCVRRDTGGQKGWRLPSPSEMRSLVGPAVDAPGPNIPPGHPFLNIQSTSYWTVVPEANLPSYARYVDAFLGNVLSVIKIYTFPVWCVRGPLRPEEY